MRWWFSSQEIPDIAILSSSKHLELQNFENKSFKLQTDINSRVGVIGKFGDYSTGIVWDECNLSVNVEDLNRHRLDYLVEPGLDSVQIELKNVQCWHKAALDYIVIEICNQERNILKNYTFSNLIDTVFTFKELNPFTLYSLRLMMFSSIFYYGSAITKNVTTLENFEDPPRNLKVIEATNKSVTLSWEPPFNVNPKHIKYYNVFQNEVIQYQIAGTNLKVDSLACNTTYEFWISTHRNVFRRSSSIIQKTKDCCESNIW